MIVEKGLKLVQVVNTLEVSDGGPARHAWELGLSINDSTSSSSRILYLKGDVRDSVFLDYAKSDQANKYSLPKKIVLWGQNHGRLRYSNVVKEIMSADAVILHGYYLIWTPLFVMLAKFCKKHIFLIPHGSLTSWQSKTHRWRKLVWDFSAGLFVRKNIEAFLLGSVQEKEDLARTFPHSRSYVIGVGTNLENVQPHLSPIHEPLRLISLSRISPKKRIEISILATEYLTSLGQACILQIAGDLNNDYGHSLRKLVTERKLEECVDFVGEVAGRDKENLLRSGDIFLLPSADENFGIAVAEAAIFGLPIVASTDVASAKLLPSAVATVLSSPTPHSLALAIQDLAGGDFIEKRSLIQTAAKSMFNWSKTSMLLTQIVSSYVLKDLSNVGQSEDTGENGK